MLTGRRRRPLPPHPPRCLRARLGSADSPNDCAARLWLSVESRTRRPGALCSIESFELRGIDFSQVFFSAPPDVSFEGVDFAARLVGGFVWRRSAVGAGKELHLGREGDVLFVGVCGAGECFVVDFQLIISVLGRSRFFPVDLSGVIVWLRKTCA